MMSFHDLINKDRNIDLPLKDIGDLINRAKIWVYTDKNISSIEHIIKRYPSHAFRYAVEVKNERWPEAEENIKKDKDYWKLYEYCFLKPKPPDSELRNLFRWGVCAYQYSKYIAKERVPVLEQWIIDEPSWSYWYAHDVIKGRWPEAETCIRSVPYWSSAYASNIIKGRWLEAEPEILRDPIVAKHYVAEIEKIRDDDQTPQQFWGDNIWLNYFDK